jgi:phosphatidylethanolamine-binding protein (PEBP) family uncharacterized protein
MPRNRPERDLLKAMNGHVLAKAVNVGILQR